MKRLTTNSEDVLSWAVTKGFHVDRLVKPIPIGVVDDKSGTIRGAVIFDNFNGVNIHMHVLSDGSKTWLNREHLHFFFDYPFNVLHAKRITGYVDVDNPEAIAFDENLGFKLEGRLRKAGGRGQDVLIYRMFREECRYI